MDEQPAIGSSFDIGRALNHGLLAIRVAAAPMWVAGLLMSISDGCGGSVPDLSKLARERGQTHVWLANPPKLSRVLEHLLADETTRAWVLGAVLGFVLVVLLVGFALFALHCWLQTGFVRLHVNILEHASDDLAPLFTGRDRFRAMLGYNVLSGLSLLAAAMITAWPGLLLAYYGFATERHTLIYAGIAFIPIIAAPVLVFVALGAYLGPLAVALDDATPVHALRRSWALAHRNRWPLLGFAVVCWLVQLIGYAGILLCCVGVLGTLPLARALIGFAKTESYLLFTRGSEQTASWRAWHRQAADDRADAGSAGQAPPPGAT
jgi:hypothetical protein